MSSTRTVQYLFGIEGMEFTDEPQDLERLVSLARLDGFLLTDGSLGLQGGGSLAMS